MKILLVEDSEDLAGAMAEILTEAGFDVAICTGVDCETEQQTSDHLGGAGCDVLVLDLGLRWTAGTELVWLAEQEAPGVPLVVCSGTSKRKLAALRGHAFAVIEKPFVGDDLVAAVEAAGTSHQAAAR